MASPALREFDRQFKSNFVGQLSRDGFELGEDRTFRRIIDHENTRSIQIIEFQIGRKGWSIGRFTVNLAVFNPACGLHPLPAEQATRPCSFDCLLTQRIGFFRSPRLGMIDRILRRKRDAFDYWWHQYSDAPAMQAEIREVMLILRADGFAWLKSRTSMAAFEWAHQQLARRKEWKESLGSLKAPRYFDDDPFPSAT